MGEALIKVLDFGIGAAAKLAPSEVAIQLKAYGLAVNGFSAAAGNEPGAALAGVLAGQALVALPQATALTDATVGVLVAASGFTGGASDAFALGLAVGAEQLIAQGAAKWTTDTISALASELGAADTQAAVMQAFATYGQGELYSAQIELDSSAAMWSTAGQALRVRPETLSGITEFSEHEADGGEAQEGECATVEIFPVFGEAATATKPGNGAFDDPAFGQRDETFGLITAADYFGGEVRHDLRQVVVKDRPGIGAVGKQLPEKRELSEQRGQNQESTVAILNVRRCDQRVQQETQRIDENVTLLAFDQLAAIEPRRVDPRPPFSALFTL